MEAETEEYVFEKEASDPFGIDSFVARSENDPLRKAVVNHDQQGIKTGRGRQTGDKVDRELLERVGAGGWQGGKGGDGWVSIYFHLLAESATSDEATDERRHTRPPVVPGKKGVSANEATMTGGRRSVTVLFPHRSVLLFFHTRCLLTWRGRRLYTNTSYLFIRTNSSFCFFDLSMDLANS